MYQFLFIPVESSARLVSLSGESTSMDMRAENESRNPAVHRFNQGTGNDDNSRRVYESG